MPLPVSRSTRARRVAFWLTALMGLAMTVGSSVLATRAHAQSVTGNSGDASPGKGTGTGRVEHRTGDLALQRGVRTGMGTGVAVLDAGGHVPTWSDEQRATFHRMVTDNRAARAYGDDIYQQAVAQQAALFAEDALDAQAGPEERYRAALGASVTLDPREGGVHGRLLHAPGVEQARVRLAERLVSVSRAMVRHGDASPGLGLDEASVYFADPSSAWFNPGLAAGLERQRATVAGRRSLPERIATERADALERCAHAGRCTAEDQDLLQGWVKRARRGEDGDGTDVLF